MEPRTRDTLAWGMVSLLAFLVLVQGYELATDASVALAVKAGVALLVGVAGAAGAALTRRWLRARAR